MNRTYFTIILFIILQYNAHALYNYVPYFWNNLAIILVTKSSKRHENMVPKWRQNFPTPPIITHPLANIFQDNSSCKRINFHDYPPKKETTASSLQNSSAQMAPASPEMARGSVFSSSRSHVADPRYTRFPLIKRKNVSRWIIKLSRYVGRSVTKTRSTVA